MTSIDQYQPCVCGSGKKFKFCKCGAVDNAADLEKILKLMDGNQELAALERINALLSKIPNASWLLALKAELNLVMQELPQFVETTNRFLKLKPDNPLALIFRSMAASLQEEPLETQARYLLEGMAESRESLSSHALFAVHSLVNRMRASDSVGMIGLWGELHEKSTSQDPGQSVMRDPTIHLACKSASPIVDSPASSPWEERLQEVSALASAFRFEQCEKKVQSILRDYPSQPGPLSHLLRAQISQLERWPAIATAKKLSELNEVSEQQRLIFRLLAWEFEQKPLEVAAKVLYGEIDSDEKLIEALNALEETRSDDMEESRAFMGAIVGDEVPAKRVFQIFQKSESENGTLYSFVGIVGVYGKQTDKPARVLFMAADYPAHRELIDKVVAQLSISKPISEAPEHNQSYVDFLGRNRFVDNNEKPWVSIQERGQLLVDEFLNLPQKVLDGKTPLEVANDERKRADLKALLLHLEGSTQLVVPDESIDEIYRRLEIEQPAKTVPDDKTQFVMASYLELLRLDYTQISDSLLIGIVQLAISKGVSRLMYNLAREIIRREDKSIHGQLAAYNILLELDPDLRNKLGYVEKLEQLNAEAKRPVGRMVMFKVDLLRLLESEAKAQEYLMQAAKKYPTDPELAAFFQQLQAFYQSQATRGGDDLGMKILSSAAERQAAKEQSSGGGIILPGQSQPASQGESKLWLPGT